MQDIYPAMICKVMNPTGDIPRFFYFFYLLCSSHIPPCQCRPILYIVFFWVLLPVFPTISENIWFSIDVTFMSRQVCKLIKLPFTLSNRSLGLDHKGLYRSVCRQPFSQLVTVVCMYSMFRTTDYFYLLECCHQETKQVVSIIQSD